MRKSTLFIISFSLCLAIAAFQRPSGLLHTNNLTPRSLSELFPNKGTDVKDEIQCYGLPYGGIGFTSHIITYYTITFLLRERSPWTWKKTKHWLFDCGLATLGLIATMITSTITLVKCRNRWQFICLALWKLCLSLTLSSIAIHSALLIRKKRIQGLEQERHEEGASNGEDSRIVAWFFVYVIGLVIGLSGLISLVRQNWTEGMVKVITLNFSCMILTFLSLTIVLWLGSEMERRLRLGYTSLQAFEVDWLDKQSYEAHETHITIIKMTSTDPQRTSSKLSPRMRQLERGLKSVEVFVLSIGLRQRLNSGSNQSLSVLGVMFRISWYLFFSAATIIGIFGALYSDFILGALGENMTGWPSSDNAVLYWTYFAAKRLPLLFV